MPLIKRTNFNISLYVNKVQKGMCIKGLNWPPLELKTENCFSQISFDWFVRRMTEV